MPLADYAHWNEDAEYMWWHEEGKHAGEPPEYDYEDDIRESEAADAFAEEMWEHDDEGLRTMLADDDYMARWPKARPIIEGILRERGGIAE